MKSTTPENIQKLLKEVLDHFDKEDTAVRERQIRTWRKLKLMWEGVQNTWYSEIAHDWRIYDASSAGGDTDQSYYDKPINVFRAYLESIIAALSVTVPPVKCYPDDADNTLDLSTAKAGDKIANLVYRHNDVSLLWVHALFIYVTEGMTAFYNYSKTDDSYGMYKQKQYDESDEVHQYVKCPNCGNNIQDDIIQSPEFMAIQDKLGQKHDEFMPGAEDVEMQDFAQGEEELCPACMQMIIPQLLQETLIVTRLVGETSLPKSRVHIEAYGGLYVKVANYAKTQLDTPYLIYAYETHYANAIERYDHLYDKKSSLTKQKIASAIGMSPDPYEQYGRISPQYQGEYPINNVTVRNAWLRPSSFNILNDKNDVKALKEKFPNGAKVVFVNDSFAEACNESLDDCWTLTYNPLADFIHHDPLGLLLVSIQEITNDLISLIIQTIEHGIGQTFADSGVLNFDAYRQMETVPGGIYEAKAKSGQKISDGFHEIKTANLSPEVMPFVQHVQSMAQLVSGALPSLFGGSIEGSETASQYSMSRAQALQRLQNIWKIFTTSWKQIFSKVIPMYIKEVQEDERNVERTKDGGFINTFIRKAELEGRIGRIELEANENLPLTWSQQKDIIMNLLQAANPEILAVLGAPENLPIIREAIGLDDFFVPGEDDVERTYEDIKLLLNSTPIPTGMPSDNPMGAPAEVSSVEIDPDYANASIQFEIVRKWIIGEVGRQAKMDNPEGYRNVLLYGKSLKMLQMQEQMMEQQMNEQPSKGSVPPKEGADKNKQAAPVTGENDVTATQ